MARQKMPSRPMLPPGGLPAQISQTPKAQQRQSLAPQDQLGTALA
jgi:hypothetical protein